MTDAAAPLVHYLTLQPLLPACQLRRKDLEGAPLNTRVRRDVTCPACLDVLSPKEPAP